MSFVTHRKRPKLGGCSLSVQGRFRQLYTSRSHVWVIAVRLVGRNSHSWEGSDWLLYGYRCLLAQAMAVGRPSKIFESWGTWYRRMKAECLNSIPQRTFKIYIFAFLIEASCSLKTKITNSQLISMCFFVHKLYIFNKAQSICLKFIFLRSSLKHPAYSNIPAMNTRRDHSYTDRISVDFRHR